MKTLLIGLLPALLCTGCLKKPYKQADWEVEAPGFYHFEDYDLRLNFQAQGAHFQWRFHNKARKPMRITYPSFYFAVADKSETYSPWGAPKRSEPAMPDIEIRPGGFVTLRYPVRFRSPLYPFKPDHRLRLHFTVSWEKRLKNYRLVFPGDQETGKNQANTRR